MFIVFISLSVLFCWDTTAQQSTGTSREFSISAANDAFLLLGDDLDRFYSFGFGANLKFKNKKILGLEKSFPNKLNSFYQVGFRIEGYTPTNKEVTDFQRQNNTVSFDRPFAGVTYGTFDINYAFERSNFRTGILLGLLGANSGAGDIQTWFHRNITDDIVFEEEWDFEVPNQLIFNINIAYAYDFTPDNKWFDIYGTGNLQAGNYNINATPAIGLRLGKFEKLSQSIGLDNNLLSADGGFELFLQSTLSGTVNIFDATAQGNIFRQDFEFAVEDLNSIHSTITHSIYLVYSNISFGYEQYFTRGKTLKNAQHSYARILLKYRF